MFIGMVAALLAAVLFGSVAVVQAAAVRRHGLLSPMMLAVAGLYVLGWLLHLIAIARMPLYLAQVGVAFALVVTALIASSVMGEPLRRRHWSAVVAMVAGLCLLAVASGSVGHSEFEAATTLVLYLVFVANALLGWLASALNGQLGGVLLGILSGLSYGATPVATRALVEPHLDMGTLLPALSIGLFGVLGFVLYSEAMKRTSVTAATAPMTLLQTVIPAVVGLAIFGDEVRDGWWPVAFVAFAVSVAAAVVLCGAKVRLELLQPDHAHL